MKKRGLGKGLEALLGTKSPDKKPQDDNAQSAPLSSSTIVATEQLTQLPIEALTRGVYQPRRDMASEALEELAESIRQQGIIQPIIVRPLGDAYEILAGERRWRAAQLADLAQVPCLIRTVTDDDAGIIALIENIQREDLNAMEEAIALERLVQDFSLTHQQVATAVGKSRTTVSNLLRLNSLMPAVKQLLEHGDLDMGHARALLAIEGEQQVALARSVVSKGLTVRETERLIQKTQQNDLKPTPARPDPDVQRLENQLIERLGAKVQIQHSPKGRGKIVISYQDLNELDGILIKIRD